MGKMASQKTEEIQQADKPLYSYFQVPKVSRESSQKSSAVGL
jgi:hypothetical protein